MKLEDVLSDPELADSSEHPFDAHEMWEKAPDPDDVSPVQLPRSIDDYAWSRHFGRRVMMDARPPDYELAAETIAEGRIGEWQGAVTKITMERHGMRITIVVGLNDELQPHLRTAYPEVLSLTKALSREEYDGASVQQSFLKQVVDEGDPWNDAQMRRIGFRDPTPMYGHNVYTHKHACYMRCDDCGKRINSKGQLVQTDCR